MKSTISILVSISDKQTLKVTKKALTPISCSKIYAETIEECFNTLSNKLPTFLITDQCFSNVEEHQELLKLGNGKYPVGVIFIDSSGESKDPEPLFANGAIEFLSAPINVTQITTKLERHIDYINLKEQHNREKVKADEAEEKLKSTLKTQQEIIRLKSNVVNLTSHQFRTPLAVIQANVEILKVLNRNITDEGAKNMIETVYNKIQKEVKNMVSLMDDVLTMGKLDAWEITHDPQEIDIIDLCNNVADSYNLVQPDKRKIKVYVSGKEKWVISDERLLEIATSNLVSNAFKYSIDSKSPELHLLFEKDEVKIEVRDFGKGIRKVDIQKLFTPFFRGKNSETIKGTGLGLHITQQCVDLLNGRIEVKSEYRKGSKFTIIIPIKYNVD